MDEFSFQKGWSQVMRKDCKAVRKKIMNALGLKEDSRMSFGRRLKGEVEPRISEAKAIEKIFAEYGIKKVWGKA